MDAKSDEPRWWLEKLGVLLPESPADIAAPVSDILNVFWSWLPWADVTQPFAGSLDEWPNRYTEGLAIARSEWYALTQWRLWRARKE